MVVAGGLDPDPDHTIGKHRPDLILDLPQTRPSHKKSTGSNSRRRDASVTDNIAIVLPTSTAITAAAGANTLVDITTSRGVRRTGATHARSPRNRMDPF